MSEFPPIGAYWVRAASLPDGWHLADVDIWTKEGAEPFAKIPGFEEPFWPNELPDAEWRRIDPPTD